MKMAYLILLVTAVAMQACGGAMGPMGQQGPAGDDGLPGEIGPTGAPGVSCTVTQSDLGALIVCPDGTSALIQNQGRTCVRHHPYPREHR